MSYKQQGNSCGAWCATHRIQIGSGNLTDSTSFVAQGKKIYAEVKYLLGEVPPAFSAFVSDQYSDPWKIMDKLEYCKMPHLHLEVEVTAQLLSHDLYNLVLNARSSRGRHIGARTLRQLPGKYAIALFQSGSGLHYMLVRKGARTWEVYDPRFDALTWEDIGAPPGVGSVLTTDGGSNHYRYMGAYIAC